MPLEKRVRKPQSLSAMGFKCQDSRNLSVGDVFKRSLIVLYCT